MDEQKTEKAPQLLVLEAAIEAAIKAGGELREASCVRAERCGKSTSGYIIQLTIEAPKGLGLLSRKGLLCN